MSVETDIYFIRKTFDLARHARQQGNHPFGALLVDDQGRLLMEGENTVITDHDFTAHAESRLVQRASAAYGSAFLANCT